MKFKLRFGLIAFTAILVGFLSVATLNLLQPHNSSKEVGLTAAQARVEYKTTERQWPLPPGFRYDSRRAVPDSVAGRPQFYEPGAAANSANIDWFCSWVEFSARGPAMRNRAADELTRYRQTRLYKAGSDQNTKELLKSVVKSASLGQDSQALAFTKRNCH